MKTFKSFLQEQKDFDILLEDEGFSDLHNLVKDNIEKHIKEISKKVRAWALENLRRAKQLGRDEAVFTKVINNPLAATIQLVTKILQNSPVK